MSTTTTELTQEQKRTLISKACGIKAERYFRKAVWTWGGKMHTAPPNYFHDLNAIQAAERTLDANGQAVYEAILYMVCGVDPMTILASETFKVFCATAAQRAEAFGKTLGLWP